MTSVNNYSGVHSETRKKL